MSDSLDVVSRKATGSRESRRLRREGMVPAVLYGHGEKSIDLAAKREAIEAVITDGFARTMNRTNQRTVR
jgi:large subunit ribosomal protein L25